MPKNQAYYTEYYAYNIMPVISKMLLDYSIFAFLLTALLE